MNMKKTLPTFAWVFCFLGFHIAFAQTIAVSGKITDGKVPLSGVSIRMKNAKVATSTNAEGIFSIQVPRDAVLVMTSLGYNLGSNEIASVNILKDANPWPYLVVPG